MQKTHKRLVILHTRAWWVKPAWSAKSTLSIPTLLMGALRWSRHLYNKARTFFGWYAACYGIYVYTLHHCNKIPSLRKNRPKTIAITICETEYRENNSRFCRYAGNKTNSAAKLETYLREINRKAAVLIRKIGLPLNFFFELWKQYRFAATISCDYVQSLHPHKY